MKVKMVAIGKLNPAAYNPRIELKAGDPEFEKLKQSIEKFGFVQPIVVNTRTGNMVGGHQRLGVAKAIGMKTVPVTEIDVDLNEEKKLNLALNKVSGKWNEEALGALLNDLKLDGEDLELTGFDEIEIEELTMAFADVDLNDDLELFKSGDNEPSNDEEDSDYEPEDLGADDRGYVIKYELIFDDEVQQETFHGFLKMLKDLYDNDAFPTHASRIHAFLKKEGLQSVKGLLDKKNAQEGK